MKITFDVQASLPDEIVPVFESPIIAGMLGPNALKLVTQRFHVEFTEPETAIGQLQELLNNELITGIQVTFEQLR